MANKKEEFKVSGEKIIFMKKDKEKYELCQCGKSKNKPFCDGAHISVGFKA